MEFHHIGLAVNNITEYYESYLKPLFGFDKITPIQTFEELQVKIAFVENSNGVRMELIEPLNGESPVNEVLKLNRGGLYHMGFTTSSLDDVIKKMEEMKFTLITKQNKLAFLIAPTFEIYEILDVS